MFELIKKKIIELLTVIVNASDHTKWVVLSNYNCMMIRPTLVNLYPKKYSQEFYYY